jgi:hypothetical protein
MTTHQPAASDGVLLDQVRAAMTSTADVPRAVYEAGYAAYSWRTVDAELAAIAYDSATELALSGTRSESPATVRAMTFTADGGLTIEIEIGTREILGQVQPADVPTIDVEERDGSRFSYPVDAVGGFVISPLPSYPFRMVLRIGASSVVTGWVTL